MIRLLAAALLVFVGLASARADLATGDTAQPTAAFVEFCRRAPHECEAVPGPERVVWTNEIWRLVRTVNRRVNASVSLVSDLDSAGVVDRWDYPIYGRGDCEDLALEKRRRLIAGGFPASAIYFAVVVAPDGTGHLVLMLNTDRGQLILDTPNHEPELKVAEDSAHWFLKRSTADPLQWVVIKAYAKR